MMQDCRLVTTWSPAPSGNGRLDFALWNLGDEPLDISRIAYTSLTRAGAAETCTGVRLLRHIANFHEFAPATPLTLAPGAVFRFTVGELNRKPLHRNDGVDGAYLTLSDGTIRGVASGDLVLKGGAAEPPKRMPAGRVTVPAAILPWPKQIEVAGTHTSTPVSLFPAPGTGLEALAAMSRCESLKARLFPAEPAVFALEPLAGGMQVTFGRAPALGAEGYRITFTAEAVAVSHGGAAGLAYALISLAQLLIGARARPDLFGFPLQGAIADAPRYGWRGCHLDVSRQVYPAPTIERFLDILAWHKLNVFHWHLSDDEGWRIEIEALPQLTTIGARQGASEILPPQSGKGPETEAGFYSKYDIRALVAHAAALHIEVVPEIDIPGHTTAVLNALPSLADPDEPPASYRSIQGYPNNALNPAVEASYAMLETVFAEVAALFPSPYLHIGGDEVDGQSWLASPLAQALMAREGLAGTAELQAHFLRRIKAMLTRLGKRMAGWNEVSHGGGVDPQDTLLVAWQSPELGPELAAQGYDVVMAPGQAYYLDMVQDEAFLEPGASWAGTVPPEKTYGFEAAGTFPEALKPRLRGIQACIWSERLTSRQIFNHMVFPRLSAVAEAAWTPPETKDFLRFTAISPLMPRL